VFLTIFFIPLFQYVAKFLSKYKDFIPKLIVGGETSRLIKSHDFSEVDMVVGSLGGLSKFITKGEKAFL